MAKVVDIERVRVDRLADELLAAIRDAFAGPGIYKVSTAEVETSSAGVEQRGPALGGSGQLQHSGLG
ncbi:MAG: hypothetical protein AB1673_11215 [Actinomycetota bacterium]